MDSSHDQTKTNLLSIKPSQKLKEIMALLSEMAELRQAIVSPKTLTMYAERLRDAPLEDVREGCAIIGRLPRKDGETAFPSFASILSVTDMAQTARHNRELADKFYHQQQACPGCGGIAEMMRPKGEQFRTWCYPCQQYRKIIPEDLALTEGEWNLLVAELTIIYQDWKRRGSNPKECIDPQFDREKVRGRVA